MLAESTLPRREVVLISDFQKNGWNRDDGVHLPEGTMLTPVAVADAKTSNVTLSSVNLQRTMFSGQERVIVTAGLVNRGEANVDGVEVSLELEGRAIQTRARRRRAERRRIDGDVCAVYADGELYARVGSLRRRCARGRQRAALRRVARRENTGPGGGARQRGPRRQPLPDACTGDRQLAASSTSRLTTLDRVGGGDLEGRRIIVLNDVPVAQAALAERIGRFVTDGGGLLFVGGERGAWPDRCGRSAPGCVWRDDRWGWRPGRGARRDRLQPSHLRAVQGASQRRLLRARFFRYRALTPAEGATVLARFDDGNVALAERKIDKGRVVVWTSTLDTFWNDLTIKPVFLPFMHRVARHLTAFVETPPWRTVGQVVEPEAVRTAGPHGGGARRGDAVGSASSAGAKRSREVVELPSRVSTKSARRAPTPQRPPAIAANVDVAESDLTPIDPQELVAAIAGRAGTTAAGGADVTLTAAQAERRQSLWWYLLFAGVLLLGIENVIGNRLSRAT